MQDKTGTRTGQCEPASINLLLVTSDFTVNKSLTPKPKLN